MRASVLLIAGLSAVVSAQDPFAAAGSLINGATSIFGVVTSAGASIGTQIATGATSNFGVVTSAGGSIATNAATNVARFVPYSLLSPFPESSLLTYIFE